MALEGYKSNHNVVYSSKVPIACGRLSIGELCWSDQSLNDANRCLGKWQTNIVMALEIMPDHVHVLVEVDPQLGIHRLVKHLKGVSWHSLRQEFRTLKSRLPTLWTNSYFVSTVGGAPLAVIQPYVENQKNV